MARKKIYLGEFLITIRQVARLVTLKDSVTLNFETALNAVTQQHKVWVIVNRDLTSNEQAAMVSSINNIDNGPLETEQEKINYTNNPLSQLTPDQAGQWVDDNVTDMESAKIAIKQMAKALVTLVRVSDLER